MVKIDSEGIYREEDVVKQLGFTFNELARARRAGTLRFRETGRGRRVYLGTWLLEWVGGKLPVVEPGAKHR